MGYKYIDEGKAHLHTLDEKPLLGTSTVVGVLDKPLTWWAVGLGLEKLGWINSKLRIKGKYITVPKEDRIKKAGDMQEVISKLPVEDWLDLLDTAYKAHSVKLTTSAKDGTDLHAELEKYVNASLKLGSPHPHDERFHDKIKPFIDWSLANVKQFILSEKNVFSRELWTGGIIDCLAELNDGKVGVIDFKSSKEAYDSQFIQASGYSLQLKENGAFDVEGNLIYKLDKEISFLAIVPFGAEEFTVDFRYNVSEFEEGFKSCVHLYKLTKLK